LTARITEAGGVAIEAVSAGGTHADLAFALAAAMGPWSRDKRSGCILAGYDEQPWRIASAEAHRIEDLGEIVQTGGGIRLPAHPFLADLGGSAIHRPEQMPYMAAQLTKEAA
jgi:hypothetical protein